MELSDLGVQLALFTSKAAELVSSIDDLQKEMRGPGINVDGILDKKHAIDEHLVLNLYLSKIR